MCTHQCIFNTYMYKYYYLPQEDEPYWKFPDSNNQEKKIIIIQTEKKTTNIKKKTEKKEEENC